DKSAGGRGVSGAVAFLWKADACQWGGRTRGQGRESSVLTGEGHSLSSTDRVMGCRGGNSCSGDLDWPREIGGHMGCLFGLRRWRSPTGRGRTPTGTPCRFQTSGR
uniref:Uncharacterized protein n=1 Tax=Esox lucius TaxID=8010 RepID=A0AAY5KDG0_ESOLU